MVRPASPAIGSPRNPGLDLVRALAALAVMLDHFTDTAWVLDPANLNIPIGGLGVGVFFALSGYVIMLTAVRTPDRRAFAVARFLRLYPTYLVCLALTTAWVVGWHIANFMVGPVDWLINFTMLAPILGFSGVDSVYWSLGYEVLFYTTIGMALPLVKRGYAPWLCAAQLAATPLLTEFASGMTTLFSIGICLYTLRHDTPRIISIKGAFVIGLLAAALVIGHHLDITLIGPAAVLIGLHLTVPRGLAAWLGAVSYPLYLLHNYIGRSLVQAEMPHGALFAIVLAMVAMVTLAALVHQVVEIRLLRAVKDRLRAAPHGTQNFRASPPTKS